MIRRAAIGLLLVLVACAPATTGLRAPGAQISSKAVVDMARLSGTWHVVAGYDRALWPVGTTVMLALEGPNATAQNSTVLWAVTAAGPGRWTLNQGAQTTDIWLLWADDTYRTAVFGNPEGSVGLILNRAPIIPADRLAAAREILTFNGYDVATLKVAR